MKLELKIRNIVLIGAFNPLSFDRHFFVKNNISKDDEIDAKSVFLPQVAQLITPSIHLTINPVQMIINSVNPALKEDDIAKITCDLVTLANGQIITASGINFVWFLNIESGEDLATVTRGLCFNKDNKIQSTFFNEDDAHFGFYSSKNILDCRMKLDVKPIKVRVNETLAESEAIQFDFNFHRDYKEANTDLVLLKGTLDKYKLYREESERIISSVHL